MSDQCLRELAPIAHDPRLEPDLVLGSGSIRTVFSIGEGPQQRLVFIDTLYGNGRMFRDEIGLAATFHEKMVAIAPDLTSAETAFPGSVFGIVETDSVYVLEMELGAAAIGRGFSEILWQCEIPDIVMERNYAGGKARLVLFDGEVFEVDMKDGSAVFVGHADHLGSTS